MKEIHAVREAIDLSIRDREAELDLLARDMSPFMLEFVEQEISVLRSLYKTLSQAVYVAVDSAWDYSETVSKGV